jgi:hypothetical protein
MSATFIRGVEAAWPPAPAFAFSGALPPLEEQALRAIIGTTAATSAAFRHENFFTENLL